MKLMQATLLLALTPLCNASQKEADFKAISDMVQVAFKNLSEGGELDPKIFKIGDEVEFKDYRRNVHVDATDPLLASDKDGKQYDYDDIRNIRYFQVGDRVRVETATGAKTGALTVLGWRELQIRVDGGTADEVFSKENVERELQIGDHVRIRDLEGDPWTVGHVTQLAPLHVKDHNGTERDGEWNQVDEDSIIREGDELQSNDYYVTVKGIVEQNYPLIAKDEYGAERKFEDIHGMLSLNHQVGHRVRVRTLDSDLWQDGTVAQLNPLTVQADNMDHALAWGQVSRDWENTFDSMVDYAIRYPDLDQAHYDLENKHDQEVTDHEALKITHANETNDHQVLQDAHDALKITHANETNDHQVLQDAHDALKITHANETNALQAKYTQETNAHAEEKVTLEKERNSLEAKREEEKTTLAAKHEEEKTTLETKYGEEKTTLEANHKEEKTTLEANHKEEKTTLEEESEKNRKLMIAFSVLFSLCAVAVIALSVLLVLKAKKTQSNSDNQAIA